MDITQGRLDETTRNHAWSSNVGHYITLFRDYVEVQRWDRHPNLTEKYSQASVLSNLEKFHTYLEKDTPKQDISIVPHIIRVFRRLRAVLGEEFSGSDALNAFLFLIARSSGIDSENIYSAQWNSRREAEYFASAIRDDDWQILKNELLTGRPLDKLVPNLNLLLRHASGQLFQEAHYEVSFIDAQQLTFSGFLPKPVKNSGETSAVGLHFTPPALVRTMVEEALFNLELNNTSVIIFDPACGSGEFLRESLRQLKLRSYSGHISVIGWDVSTSACDMASFVLAHEVMGMGDRVHIDITCTDSLSPDLHWPENVDIALMNPPFVSWEKLTGEQKQNINDILGEVRSQRTDLSHAFVWKSVLSLRDGGVLGSILPASFLDGASAQKLRYGLSDIVSHKIIARLGSLYLFPGATIDASFYLAKKQSSSGPTIAFWANQQSSSSSSGLRMLRRLRYTNENVNFPILRDGFNIYLTHLDNNTSNWDPRPYRSWRMLQSLDHLPRVSDVFDVRQGVRTGNNSSFLLSQEEFSELPASERKYFRPAIVSKSIAFGFLRTESYIFYPYGKYSISNEAQLERHLSLYYTKHLLPDKESLLNRLTIQGKKWWELSEHRTWQEEYHPKLVSTYFGDAESFAWDDSGDMVVVQGYAWIPRFSSRTMELQKKINLAYLVILNSKIFSDLLSAVSNPVSGGQWNLSTKFVNNIAIPNLFLDEHQNIIEPLADLGHRIHEGINIDDGYANELVRSAYNISE